MEKFEKTIGEIKVNTGIACQSVLDMKITSMEGMHGTLAITFETDEGTAPDAVRGLKDMPVTVSLGDGTRLFAGICTSAALETAGGYKKVHVGAATASIKMDRKPVKKTFQDPSKTLRGVAEEVCQAYGADITLDSDMPIKQVLSQDNETDWQFLKRIAAAQGKVLFTDILADGIRIFMGETGFREEDGSVLGEAAGYGRDGAELASMVANTGSGEGYDVDMMSCETGVLTLSAGDRAGRHVIRKGEITVRGGVIVNTVGYGYPDSVRPTVEASSQPGFSSSILQGRVTAVEGNEIQVQFDTDAGPGNAAWVPYESSISNNFYCMPDIGDTVYIYYENNGKIVCLGSHHKNTGHPDMQKPEEKVLTSRDKMIRFGTTGITLSATRERTDNEDCNAVSITMDEKDGITINSGREIIMASGGNIVLGVNVPEDAGRMAESGQEKLNKRVEKGKEEFRGGGGYLRLIGEQYIGHKLEQLENGIKGNFIYGIVSGMMGKEEEETPDAEQFETGVLTLYGYEGLRLEVGDSSIVMGGDIHIYAEQFQWLGYEQGSHQKEEVPLQDWWETALDGLQLVLDIAGCFPVLGAVPDLLNAGVSLLRGDVSGALMSAVAAIPGVGDAVGVAKIAGKAFKASKKLKKMIAIAKGVYMMLQSAYSIYQMRDGWANIIDMMKKGENPFTDPGNVSILINTASSGVMFCRGAKNVSDATGATGKIKKKLEGAKEKRKAKQEAKKKNKVCKKDPIDVVTGSLTMEYADLVLKDINEDFILKRVYESVYTNKGMMLGNRWFLNIETRLNRDENLITLQKTDMGLEHFIFDNDVWKNVRNGDESIILRSIPDGYKVYDAESEMTYIYNADGYLIYTEDSFGNRRNFEYEGDVLRTLTFPSGQFLKFKFKNGKLSDIEDTIGRHISYMYEGEFLTEVILPNGGKIHYTYTNKGYIHQVTDQNGNVYVTNEYDYNGRVTKQILATGEEYIIYYDDRNRRNVISNPLSGEYISYEYGSQKILLKEINKDGTYYEKRYDKWENCIYERDFNGNETFREYSISGKLIKEKNADGTVVSLVYNDYDKLIERSNSIGAKEYWEYNDKGMMVRYRKRIEDERYAVTSYTYDGHGRILSETNPNGNTTYYEYKHGFSTPTMKVMPGGEIIWYSYDSAGRLMIEKNMYGQKSYGYNRADRVTSIVDELGNKTHYSYDLLGNILEIRQPVQYALGIHGIRYEYDALDRKIVEETAEGNIYKYRYGNEDCMVCSIHPNAAAEGKSDGIAYEYDECSRKIRTIYPDGGIERYFYDANGNQIKKIKPESYIKQTDNGSGYEYSFDCLDRLISIKNPMGEYEATYSYDGNDQLLSCSDALSDDYGMYKYNSAGWRTEKRVPVELDEQGEILYCLTTYQYDDMGNVIEEKRYLDYQNADSAYGKTNHIRYEYDCSNRLAGAKDSTGAELKYEYDKAGRRIKELLKIRTDSYRELRYVYDKAGNMTEKYERLEDSAKCAGENSYAITEYNYDANRNITSIKLPEGGMLTYKYDNDNRIVEEHHVEMHGEIDNKIIYRYDHAGNIISRIDVYGNETKYEYDLMNRQISSINPDGGMARKKYDLNGRIICEISPQENWLNGSLAHGYQFEYDIADRMVGIVGPDGKILERRILDKDGNLLKLYEGVDNLEELDKKSGICFTYNLSGRRKSITTPKGVTQKFIYDAMGNLTETIDGRGYSTKFNLDEWGRIITVSKADGSKEHYTYDFAGNITSAKDGEGHIETFQYNCRNLMEKRIDNINNVETYKYDREGNIAERIDRNGNILTYDYNMYGSVVLRRSKSGDVEETYGYYADGKLRYAIGGGMRYDYTYDNMGRLEEKKTCGRILLKKSYDMNGNLHEYKDFTGKSVRYVHNLYNQLTVVYDNGVRQSQYEYDAVGNLIKHKIGDKIVTHYKYDIDNNLMELKTFIGGREAFADNPYSNLLVDNSYEYDNNGNMQTKKTITGINYYKYDEVNRLVNVTTPGYEEYFKYDKAGNRTERVTLYTDLLEGMNGGKISNKGREGNRKINDYYHYDKANRLMKVLHVEEGSETKWEYKYDMQGNLISDEKCNYEYDSGNRIIKVENYDGNYQENHYDAEGLRAEILENGELVRFLFDKGEVIAQTEADGNITRYIRGLDLISSDSDEARTYYHYVSDENGSITHILGASENEYHSQNYTVLNEYEYDSFGNIVHSVEKVNNRFCYIGQQYDRISQQYYLRARYYSPTIARFIQEDTYYGDGLNLYTYCQNNPLIYKDVNGNYRLICDKKYNDLKSRDPGSLSEKEKKQIERYETSKKRREEREARKAQKANGKNGETEATKIGKKVHKERADERRENDLYASVNEKLTDADGNVIEVPHTVDKQNKEIIGGMQSAMPDAVIAPDKGGYIIDDKPNNRDVLTKDYQEMGRNVEAYTKKYGEEPNKVIIHWYDSTTGADMGYTMFEPELFKRF